MIIMNMTQLIKAWRREDPYSANIFMLHDTGKWGNSTYHAMEYKKASKSWRNFLKRNL